ncbi:M48 family metallopeptidase [Methylovulum psychrotolerans]|uniref:M48 family peptidase n=1 Tax=Methylovulum psychrotolerans TaxID=1704499 RepID=A0A2S5CGV6_9GAMM|nr:SprT family zinc-dependent metalloprotease [Methylovulum psychrotolerans]POZ50024.1 M48 family peptidase [Methylovulum psychrotolerans]
MGRLAQSLWFGETEIVYAVNACDRKTLAIHVYPDGAVVVDAPMTASAEAIAAKVKKNAAWIFKQQRQFAAYPPVLPPRQYVSGETHRYLGRQYRLLILHGEAEQVRLSYGRLAVVTVDPNNTGKVKALLQNWYRLRANTVFLERYDVCLKQVAKLGIAHDQGFQLRFMPKRWGSCTSQGHIILNPELIAAPKDCIDYVITHELCHLQEHNHSRAFYRLLAAVMKDWELRRKRLNEMVEVRFV